MPEWSFLTNHARVLLCIARDPGVRLPEIAAALNITERTAYVIVTDLSASEYIVKERDGRRNRYRVEHRLPLREPTVGGVLGFVADFTPPPARVRRKSTNVRRPRTPGRR